MDGRERLFNHGGRIGIIDIDGKSSLMEEGLFVPVKDGLLAQLQHPVRPQRNAAHGRLAGRAEYLDGVFGGIRAFGNLGLLCRKLHGKGHARIGTAFPAIRFGKQFLNL